MSTVIAIGQNIVEPKRQGLIVVAEDLREVLYDGVLRQIDVAQIMLAPQLLHGFEVSGKFSKCPAQSRNRLKHDIACSSILLLPFHALLDIKVNFRWALSDSTIILPHFSFSLLPLELLCRLLF